MSARIAVCTALLLWSGVLYAVEEDHAERSDAKQEAQAKFKLIEIEKNIIELTNQERARYGLPALETDKELVKSARQHAIWMTRNRTLQHTHKPVAENIALGYRTSRDAVRAWMNSSGHRANILSGGHRKIGVAAYETERGTIFRCQQFRR